MKKIVILAALTLPLLVWYFQASDSDESLVSAEASGEENNQQSSGQNTAARLGDVVSGEAVVKTSPQNTVAAPEPTEQAAEREPLLDQWREELSSSGNAEDLLVVATLERDPDAYEALLFEALLLDPQNTLVNFMVIEHCLSSPNSTQCGPHVFDVLDDLDSNNGMVRDFKAIQTYRDGDVDTALVSLGEALSTKVADDYQWQHMAAVGEALSQRGQNRNGDFVKAVFQATAARSGERMSEMMRMCQEQSSNAMWRDICFGRGLALSKTGLSMSSQMLGYSMVVNSSASSEGLRDHYMDQMIDKGREYHKLTKALKLDLSNPDWQMSGQQWQHYVSIYANSGELEALKYLSSIGN